MNKNLLILFILTLSLLSCGGQNKAESQQGAETESEAQEPELPSEAEVVVMDSTYVPVSTFGLSFDGDPRPGVSDESMEMPKIKGLYTSDRWAFCKKDSCVSGRYLVGIRCPQNTAVRRWLNNELWERTKNENFDKKAPEGMVNSLEVPIRKVTDFYLDQWRDGYNHFVNDTLTCENSGRFSSPTEQFGLIITDVWQDKSYYTMCLHSWYDMLSCGCPYSTSFYTIDGSSGKVLSLNDIIAERDTLKIERLLLGKLAWMKKQRGTTLGQDINYLKSCMGVALIKEGLLMYFHPYSIGVGFEGQYNVVIPFNQLEKEGVTLKLSLK